MKMLCLDQPLPGATMENYKPARIVIFLSVALLLSAPLHAQRMEISSNGSRASVRGAAETFTGTVFVESLFAATEQTRATGGQVTFEPGARSAWHTHPAGQTLIITSGAGWVQEWNGEKLQVEAGDVIRTPPGVKHWHGATATTGMTHIAIQESVAGRNVDWMEQVTDEQYGASVGVAPDTPVSPGELRSVAPALDRFRQHTVQEDLWKRAGLSPRDRSLVTVAALIARNQTAEMREQFTLALDNGVRPGELSEVITHLAFYSGGPNATAAVAVAKNVFATRHITVEQLPPASGELLPLDEAAERQRAAAVAANFGAVAPGVVQYTTDLLFGELWRRPALTPRDRSLVTVSALIASGQVEQMAYHLNRAMDNGLTRAEASEVLTHLAFYAGWPNVFSALPVAKSVFEARSR